jgi:hypothetical protein
VLERYRELLINRSDTYARQSKAGAGYYRVQAPVTDAVLEQHLAGAITGGWYCLNPDSRVKWAVVDLDDDEAGIQTAQTLYRRFQDDYQLPTYIESSRDQRAHLWLFLTPAWPAQAIRQLLQGVLGDPPGQIEIFPKQDRLRPGRVGSLVRGPLGVHRKTGEVYPFLSPDTLERIEDPAAYLGQMQTAEGEPLAQALNALLREPPRSLRRPPARAGVLYPHRDPSDTLAVAERLGIPLDWKENYAQGICPFHPAEEHPSFTIYPNTHTWICWHEMRMGRGGVSLYAAVRGISYREAWEILKERR